MKEFAKTIKEILKEFKCWFNDLPKPIRFAFYTALNACGTLLAGQSAGWDNPIAPYVGVFAGFVINATAYYLLNEKN